MIQMYTYLDVADNTGAKECMCIKVLGGTRRRYAGLGDIIVASIKKAIPGGDVNPYLAFAALLVAGLHGIEQELELPPPLEGNAYVSDAERFPGTLREAVQALETGSVARAALGDEVVDHYLNYARTEQRLFDQVVTGYERERMFERG